MKSKQIKQTKLVSVRVPENDLKDLYQVESHFIKVGPFLVDLLRQYIERKRQEKRAA